MADLAARLRAAGRPVPAALEQARAEIRTSATTSQSAAAAVARSLDVEASFAPAPAPMPAPAPAPVVETRVEPIAEAPAPVTYVAQDPAVAIQRFEPQPAAFAHADPVQEIDEPVARPEPQIDRRPYIPPTAERPAAQARMPRVDEFPPIAQRQMTQPEEHHDEERRPMSLLKRLAHGLSRREDHEPEAQQPREPSFAAQPREPAPYQPAGHDEFAKRPAPRMPAETGHRPASGHLDPMGRAPTANRLSEEDQLEIPAFLRRQAN